MNDHRIDPERPADRLRRVAINVSRASIKASPWVRAFIVGGGEKAKRQGKTRMPSELDRQYDAVLAEVTGPDGRIQIGRDAQAARSSPICRRPCRPVRRLLDPARRDEALVAGDERMNFASRHKGDAARPHPRRQLEHRQGRPGRIAMRNCPAWIVGLYGGVKAGGIATLINGWWQAEEMRHALGLVEPS